MKLSLKVLFSRCSGVFDHLPPSFNVLNVLIHNYNYPTVIAVLHNFSKTKNGHDIYCGLLFVLWN